MPGKYIAKNYAKCHCDLCNQSTTITWFGDPNIQLDCLEKHKIQPEVPYALWKRKRWTIENELERELTSNSQFSAEQRIFFTKLDPYFYRRSTKCVHNHLDEDATSMAKHGRRLNVKSYIRQLLNAKNQTDSSNSKTRAFKSPRRRRQQHRDHHKPREPVVDSGEYVTGAPIASIEMADRRIFLKSVLYDSGPMEQIDPEKHELYEDIQDAYREYILERSCAKYNGFDAEQSDDDDDDDDYEDAYLACLAWEVSEELKDQLNKVDKPVDVKFAPRFTQMSLPWPWFHSSDRKQSRTTWFTIHMPELLLVDIRTTLTHFQLPVDQVVAYLTYYTPLNFIVNMSELLRKNKQVAADAKQPEAYMLISQQSEHCITPSVDESTAMNGTYFVQLQVYSTEDRHNIDLSTRYWTEQQHLVDGHHDHNQLYLASFIDLIGSAQSTISDLITDRENNTDHQEDEFEVLGVPEQVDRQNSFNSDESYLIVDTPVNLETGPDMCETGRCQLCHRRIGYEDVDGDDSVEVVCTGGHCACVVCIRTQFDHESRSNESETNRQKVLCPFRGCQNSLSPFAQLRSIAAPILYQFYH